MNELVTIPLQAQPEQAGAPKSTASLPSEPATATPEAPKADTAKPAETRSATGRPPRSSRYEVVDVGLQILKKDGLSAVTLSAIGDRLGLHKVALYTYVKSKDDLLLAMRDEVNRLFDSVFRGFGETAQGAAWPSLEVRDNEGEYKVTAELPGVDEKDVELSVQDGVLTIRGEKKSETEDKERHFSERTYGRFERRIALGDIDEDKISASFENGVLTVTAPKSPQAQAKIKRIPISGKTVH